MLPGANGYRVCADLRRSGVRTPILMLTAKDGDLDEAEALDTGADDYLRKPFSFPVLVARIHALLRRASLGDPPPLTVGSLRLDPRARRAAHDGVDLPLTAREFELLSYLIRRAGRRRAPRARPPAPAGVAPPLPPREFDLLSSLTRRAGRIVPKQEILAGVWEDGYEGDPTLVEVYVARLRRKLGTAAGAASIETIRGMGYRLGAG